MNIRVLWIALLATALGTGVVHHLMHTASRAQVAEEALVRQSPKAVPAGEVGGMEPDVHPEPLPHPKAPFEGNIGGGPVEAAAPTARKQPVRQPPQAPDPSRYWTHQLKRFNGLLEQLAHEQDPSRRMALIRALASYVRIDTLEALEWAMSLQDPIEQRAALEAINKTALSGIGARIETDDSGYPIIRETTVLSAIAATGLVEPGDYIVGMVNTDGRRVSFENLSSRQVVKYLRGQPGTEVQLLMERLPNDGDGGSLTFDVSVQRSLLVIQPPY